MIQSNKFINRLFALSLIFSFIVWSVMPTIGHVPRVSETHQEHIEMVAEHGHSHGYIEDLLWAMHGHNHDESDHDHSFVTLISTIADFYMLHHKDWRQPPTKNISSPDFLIERPPRV